MWPRTLAIHIITILGDPGGDPGADRGAEGKLRREDKR